MGSWTLRILDIGHRPLPHVDMIAERNCGRWQWISVAELPNGRLDFMIPFDVPWHVKRKAIRLARAVRHNATRDPSAQLSAIEER